MTYDGGFDVAITLCDDFSSQSAPASMQRRITTNRLYFR